MTFLLQKFNAINRTRTEVRARNGLRSSASGIAFTGRLAACLLLAGFLGVGSAMAQVPDVLRMGDGAISVAIGGTQGNQEVHHYLIDTDGDGDYSDETLSAAGTNPTGQGGTAVNTFLVGGIALVTWTTGNPSTLMVTPVSVGGFKIATSRDGEADLTTGADGQNNGTPYAFVVLSGNAPRLKGAADNAAVQADMVPLELTPRDDTSKEYDLLDWFDDPNNVFLTYDASVDMVAKAVADTPPITSPLRPKVDKDGVAIASATIVGNKLTVALTKDAMTLDQTDIWVFARDGSEYARKRVQVTVGTATNPFVMTAIADDVLREDAAEDTHYELALGFMDPDVDRSGANDARSLTYAVKISDASAAKVGSDVYFTWVTSYMTARVVLRDTDPNVVGHEGGALLTIRPRAPGSATFTVTATDMGLRCLVTEEYVAATTDPAADAFCYTEATGSTNSGYNGVDPDPDNRSADQKAADAKEKASKKSTYHQAKSVSDVFTVTVVTKTSPIADEDIPAQTVVADGDTIMFDLEDLNGDKADDPMAFADPTKEGLTYTVTPKDSIATITLEGSMVTIAPIWRAGDKSTTVTVKATNNLDEESLSSTFTLTVKTATKPVVNMSPAVYAVLATGFMMNTGDAPMVVDLNNLTGADKAPFVSLFIDPNAAEGDALTGGLLLEMKVENVVADHVYENQSKTNDVTTSAMRLVLDPGAGTLTVTPTGANDATVTVFATDRERLMISATTTITVVSGVGTESEELPTEVSLSQNYPNPFNPQTTIDYALPKAGDVSLVVYDMLGRQVDVLLDGPQAAGRHTVRFGANHLPNGTYVYRLVAADKTITRTMVLVK